MFLKIALLVLKKDFAIEVRSLEILSTTLFFAVSCVLIFSFAFVEEGRAVDNTMVASAILWIAVAFAGLLAGTLGFAAVGTLFAAMLVRSRAREVMLPILLYPVTIPVLIAGVRGTSALLQSEPSEPMAMMWLGLLASFDVVFVTLALWTFEPLMTE